MNTPDINIDNSTEITIDRTPEPRPARPAPTPRNGVDVPTLFATLDAVRNQPELAQFQFRASSRWVSGTHSQMRAEGFSGAGGEHEHGRAFLHDSDHPPVLCGTGKGPAPVEFLLHGLAACLTAGIANIASARGIDLTEVTATVEGDIDLLGIFGMSDEVRNGYQQIRVSFKIRGDADADTLRELALQSRSRSAVFDVLANGTDVALEVDAG